ncbi:hypothetical protein IT568_08570 [bacterium]|nr:hypothetical protein [bacterium]
MKHKPVAEVLESTSTTFLAELYAEDKTPDFASVVKIYDEKIEYPIWAIVTNIINCGTYERQAVAFGLSRTELAKTQPQLSQLLKTRFEGIIIGFGSTLDFSPEIPPKPPLIHDQIVLAEELDYKILQDNLSFLRFFFLADSSFVDEIIFRLIAKIFETNKEKQVFVNAGKEISDYLRNDYVRLTKIINRFEILIKEGV